MSVISTFKLELPSATLRRAVTALMVLLALTAIVGCLLMFLILSSSNAHAERVKDLTSVAGVRGNQLVGYGLVVGLDGTGDQTSQAPFTIQSIRNMLAKFGVTIPANVNPQFDPDNSISSLKVADAMIGYGAKGALADANTPGLLSRFFNLGWLPF